jgi:hypothetical protein
VRFLWAEGPNAKGIHIEMFPVYGGKCLSCKAVDSRLAKVSLMTNVEMEVPKWLRQQSEDFCAAGFDALVKQWDKSIGVCGGYAEYRMFYVLYPFVTYLLILPRIFDKYIVDRICSYVVMS